MTFEDWIRTQSDARATPEIRFGAAADGSHASFMSWTDKNDGTWFWAVRGGVVELVQFIGRDQ